MWPITVVLLMFCAFVGWGRAVRRLFNKDRAGDIGLDAAIGMALAVVVGGALNLFGLISPSVFIVATVFGCGISIVFAIVQRTRIAQCAGAVVRSFRADLMLSALSGIAAAVMIIQIAGSSRGPINVHDDLHAYLVFPMKMLQTGSNYSDPFNARQMESSLGGQSILLADLFCWMEPSGANVLELGLAPAMLVALLVGYGFERGVPPKLLLAAVFVPLLILPYQSINTSSVVTTAVLFLALIRVVTLPFGQIGSIYRIFLISLLSAALVQLKSTNIPVLILFLVSYYALSAIRQKSKSTAVGGLATAVAVILLCLPSLIAMHQAYGTPLYPLLGKGLHGSQYGAFPSPSDELTISEVLKIVAIAFFAFPDFLATIYMALTLRKFRSGDLELSDAVAAAMVAIWVGTTLVVLATAGEYRYARSMTFALLLFLLIECMAAGPSFLHRRLGKAQLVALLVAGLTILAYGGRELRNLMSHGFQRPRPILNFQPERKRLMSVQASIPEGATFLVRFANPFLLDFARNRVWVADWPGNVSPPPGIPLHGSAEEMASYLRDQELRFVAYDYLVEAGFPRVPRLTMRLGSDINIWFRSTAANTYSFQDRLLALRDRYVCIYDDGHTFVLDLLRPRELRSSLPRVRIAAP